MKLLQVYDEAHAKAKVLAAENQRPLQVVGSLLLLKAIEMVRDGSLELPESDPEPEVATR